MKAASPELVALLNSGSFERADLYTITLRGGTVIRFNSSDRDITYEGNSFPMGPLVERQRITDAMGLEVSTLDLTLSLKSSEVDDPDNFKINGVPLIQFISSKGLDGANLKLERAFLPDWTSDPVGTILRFSGKITSVPLVKGISASLTVSSWAILLSNNYPVEVYQSSCMWSVYNPGCGLSESSFQSTLTVTSGSTTSVVRTSSGGGSSYQQGRILFLSGANTGLSRTVRESTAGVFTIIPPLPQPPAPGDSLKASLGCDLTPGTCGTRFNNKLRFKGTPYIPVPETTI